MTAESGRGRDVLSRLRRMRARVRHIDADSIFVEGVPANIECFTKSRSNCLVKRAGGRGADDLGRRVFVCVDEDLEYVGNSEDLRRMFSAAIRHQGWRVLLSDYTQEGLEGALDKAMAILGCDGSEPVCPSADGRRDAPAPKRLLDSGRDLTALAGEGKAAPTVGRDRETEDVLACLRREIRPALALVIGAPGTGKSNLLCAVAAALGSSRSRLISLDLGTFFAGVIDIEQENLLSSLFREAASAPGVVLALEQLHLALTEAPHGPMILAQALDDGVKIVGTALPGFRRRFLDDPLLAGRLAVVELREFGPAKTSAVLDSVARRMAGRAEMEIEPGGAAIGACVAAAAGLVGGNPGKAVALLDAACASARLRGHEDDLPGSPASAPRSLAPDDVYHAARCFPKARSSEGRDDAAM